MTDNVRRIEFGPPKQEKEPFTKEDFEEFFGCCPDFTGKKTTEEYMSEIRGDDDGCESPKPTPGSLADCLKPGQWHVPVADPTDERIKALEAELAAWRDVGGNIQWCVNSHFEHITMSQCPVCWGLGEHRQDCKLGKLLGRK